MRGFGNSQTYYYLQTLLTGDTETGRNSRTFSMAEPLAVIALQIFNYAIIFKKLFFQRVEKAKRYDNFITGDWHSGQIF